MPSPRLSGPSEFIPNVIAHDFSGFSLDAPRDLTLEQVRTLKKLGNKTMILDDLDAHEPPVKGTFVQRDELGIGRDENGRHEVQFGQLLLTSSNRREVPALVAAKYYEPHEIRELHHEIAATNHINELAEIQNSFLPLGVWRNAEGLLGMITLYEHGVKSYDNTFWVNRDEEPEALRPERLKTAFQDCIWGIGYLHGAGLIHGDAQVKNLAHDGKNVRFVDLEDIALTPKTAGGKIENSLAGDDMRTRDILTFLATALQVDENRAEIMKILQSKHASQELALYYRKGLKKGGRDSGLQFEKPLHADESNALFDHLLNSVISPLKRAS